jgi:hypothetical protein
VNFNCGLPAVCQELVTAAVWMKTPRRLKTIGFARARMSAPWFHRQDHPSERRPLFSKIVVAYRTGVAPVQGAHRGGSSHAMRTSLSSGRNTAIRKEVGSDT